MSEVTKHDIREAMHKVNVALTPIRKITGQGPLSNSEKLTAYKALEDVQHLAFEGKELLTHEVFTASRGASAPTS